MDTNSLLHCIKNRIIKILVISLLLIATSSCSFTRVKRVAESAVAQFHSQYNSGQFHEIYRQADEGFRKSTDEAKFLEYAEALHRKLGPVKQATQTRWYVNTTTTGTMATLNYDTEFSEGKGTEQFVFRIAGDKAFLYNYNVNSPLLITR